MKAVQILIILCVSAMLCRGQDGFSVVGNISVENRFAPSGNVLALNSKDSSLIKGDFFIDGYFELSGITKSEVLLHFTSLEFVDYYIEVAFNKDSILDLGNLIFKETNIELEEVVVRSEKLVYVQKANGTVAVQVQNTTLASSNSVNEILSKSPDVIIDEDGGINIFGKGNAILYLNGRRITQNQLAQISPSSIQEIQIIRNPSVRFDAEGSAVIQIITVDNEGIGHQVKLQQNVSFSDFAGFDHRSSAALSMSTRRVSAEANIGLLQGKDRHILYTTRDRDADEVFLKTDLTTDWQNTYDHFLNYGIGMQYNYHEKSYVSLEYSGFSNQLGGNQFSQNIIEDANDISFYSSNILRNERDVNRSYSFNIQQKIDTSGSFIFGGMQYAHYAVNTDNPISEKRLEITESSRTLRNKTNLGVVVLSLQTDVQKYFSNNTSLSFGFKYSSVNNQSILDFLIGSDQGYIIDPVLSNNFSYKESVIAGYGQFDGNINDAIQYSFGARLEHTDYRLQLSQILGQELQDNYINVFPQLTIQQEFSDYRSINFAYTSRINRVPYQRLNPVLIYQDPFTSIQGNPASVPEKTHNFELNTKLSSSTIRAGYNYVIDPFGGGAVRGENPKSYVLIRLNFDAAHEYYTTYSRNFETDWIRSNNTLSLRYTDIIDREHNFSKLGSKPNLYFNSINRILLGKEFTLETSFTYLGNEYEGIYARKGSWNLNMAIDRSFLSNALTCRFIINDIFHSTQAAGDYSIGETDIYFHRHWNTQYIRLSVSYNFGQLKKPTYQNKEVGRAEGNRAL